MNISIQKAARDLIDESERVFHAAQEDGTHLVHLGNSIERMKSALQSDTGKVAEAREKVVEAARKIPGHVMFVAERTLNGIHANVVGSEMVKDLSSAIAAYDAALRGGEGRSPASPQEDAK